MDIFNTIRIGLGILLFALLGINFFYQAIKGLMRLRKNYYQADTIYQFRCRNCKEKYEINGTELKTRTNIWSTRLETQTPKSQTSAIRFECLVCTQKAFQERIYDTDATALLGNVRAQFDENSKEILIKIILKGFLPILIGAPLLGLLL